MKSRKIPISAGLVYAIDGQAEAFVNMRVEGQLHHAAPVAEILELVVATVCADRESGRSCFWEACRRAAEKGCVCLDVTSGRQRTGAHRFYEREGMKKSHFKFTMELWNISPVRNPKFFVP